jgi:hypothetical protein
MYVFLESCQSPHIKAVTHPSQPNYWCMIGGDHFGINSDSNYNLNHTNLVDLFDKERITWKAYEETFPGIASCWCCLF